MHRSYILYVSVVTVGQIVERASQTSISSTGALVSHTQQVVAQLLHRVGGSAGLDCVGIVGDEDGPHCLHNHDTLLPLFDQSVSESGSAGSICISGD